MKPRTCPDWKSEPITAATYVEITCSRCHAPAEYVENLEKQLETVQQMLRDKNAAYVWMKESYESLERRYFALTTRMTDEELDAIRSREPLT